MVGKEARVSVLSGWEWVSHGCCAGQQESGRGLPRNAEGRGRKAVAMAFTAHFASVEESETQRLATTLTSLRSSPSLSGPQFRPNGNSGL